MFTGAFAINPANDARIPIFIADYVLMGYGTGAIMAVPAHDQRDFEFAARVRPADRERRRSAGRLVRRARAGAERRAVEWPEAYVGDGAAMNSANDDVSLDGLHGRRGQGARSRPGSRATGAGRGAVTYKLRDWLFSRQRYWGEPFPIVYDERRAVSPCPRRMLPVELPEITDFEPERLRRPGRA